MNILNVNVYECTHWVFFLTVAIIAVLGMVANMVIILNKGEREYLIAMFKRKLLKRS